MSLQSLHCEDVLLAVASDSLKSTCIAGWQGPVELILWVNLLLELH